MLVSNRIVLVLFAAVSISSCQSLFKDGEVQVRYADLDGRLEAMNGHRELDESKQTRTQSPPVIESQQVSATTRSQEEMLENLRQLAGLGSYKDIRKLLHEIAVSSASLPSAKLLDLLSAFSLGERTGLAGWLEDIRSDFEIVRTQLPPRDATEFLFLHAVVSGLSSLAIGDESRGMESLSYAQSLDSGREEPYLILAQHFFEQKQPSAADRVLDEALAKVQSPSVELYITKARTLRAMGDDKGFQMVLRRARQKLPDSPRLDQYEAILGFLDRSPIEACERFASLYQLQSADPDTAFNHGFCLRSQGFIEMSENVLEKALHLNPGRHDIRVLLAGVLAERNKMKEADQTWRGLKGSDPMQATKTALGLEISTLAHSSRRLIEVLSGAQNERQK